MVTTRGNIGEASKHEIEESKESSSGKDNRDNVCDEGGESSIDVAIGGNWRVDGAKYGCHSYALSIDTPVTTWISWIIQYEAKRTNRPIIAAVIVFFPSSIL